MQFLITGVNNWKNCLLKNNLAFHTSARPDLEIVSTINSVNLAIIPALEQCLYYLARPDESLSEGHP
jgi:hypothetical protein